MNIVILRSLPVIKKWRSATLLDIYLGFSFENDAVSVLSRLLWKNGRGKCPRNLQTAHYSQRTITFAAKVAQQPGDLPWYIIAKVKSPPSIL